MIYSTQPRYYRRRMARLAVPDRGQMVQHNSCRGWLSVDTLHTQHCSTVQYTTAILSAANGSFSGSGPWADGATQQLPGLAQVNTAYTSSVDTLHTQHCSTVQYTTAILSAANGSFSGSGPWADGATLQLPGLAQTHYTHNTAVQYSTQPRYYRRRMARLAVPDRGQMVQYYSCRAWLSVDTLHTQHCSTVQYTTAILSAANGSFSGSGPWADGAILQLPGLAQVNTAYTSSVDTLHTQHCSTVQYTTAILSAANGSFSGSGPWADGAILQLPGLAQTHYTHNTAVQYSTQPRYYRRRMARLAVPDRGQMVQYLQLPGLAQSEIPDPLDMGQIDKARLHNRELYWNARPPAASSPDVLGPFVSVLCSLRALPLSHCNCTSSSAVPCLPHCQCNTITFNIAMFLILAFIEYI
ncbi:hypothetical protein J6590_043316 [Homalodisca vitripennis]|nr:hypothetical protein J6590_043316 [Homalodisca vitripennis]